MSLIVNDNHHDKKGFTLIETLMAFATLIILISAVALIVKNILELIIQTKVKTAALAVAQQKIEQAQNLPYIQVGIIGGIPQGSLIPSEIISINGQKFTVDTSVYYIDDPYDDVAPDDTIPTDYKRIRVAVSWGGTYASVNPVVLMTNISPKGIETMVGGGTLIIQTINSSGYPVQGSQVIIDNTSVSPNIHMQVYTDAQGKVTLPGAPACNECYKITVTKQGYSTDKTYGTDEVPNPIKRHLSIIESTVSSMSFSIDQTSTLTLQSFNIFYVPKSFVQFTLRGSKIIGYDTNDEPVYKYTHTDNTGTYIRTILGLEWDVYDINLSPFGNTYAGSNPPLPVTLAPNVNITVPFIAGPATDNSLLIAVKNLAGALQASASATLINNALSYNLTKITPATGAADIGQVLFFNLIPETYEWRVNLNGYKEATGSMYLNSNRRQTVILEEL